MIPVCVDGQWSLNDSVLECNGTLALITTPTYQSLTSDMVGPLMGAILIMFVVAWGFRYVRRMFNK